MTDMKQLKLLSQRFGLPVAFPQVLIQKDNLGYLHGIYLLIKNNNDGVHHERLLILSPQSGIATGTIACILEK